MQSSDVKIEVLQDLIDQMKRMEGAKMRPKAVEVSMTSMKPEGMEPGEGTPMEEAMDQKEGEMPGAMQGKSDGIRGEVDQGGGGMHSEPDGDEMSPDEVAMLEKILGSDEEKEPGC